MISGIYEYFFGAEASDSSADAKTAAGKSANRDANEWIFVENASGRSSPVLVAEPELKELRDEDLESTLGEKQNHPSAIGSGSAARDRRRLRKIRKEIANQEKKRQVKELLQRRAAIEQKLFEGVENSDSSAASSVSSSPVMSAAAPPKHIDAVSKPTLQRKKKRAAPIFQPMK